MAFVPFGVCIPGNLLLYRVKYDGHGGTGLQGQLLYDVSDLPVWVPVFVPIAGEIQKQYQEYIEKCMASQYCGAAVDGFKHPAHCRGGLSFLLHEP